MKIDYAGTQFHNLYRNLVWPCAFLKVESYMNTYSFYVYIPFMFCLFKWIGKNIMSNTSDFFENMPFLKK